MIEKDNQKQVKGVASLITAIYMIQKALENIKISTNVYYSRKGGFFVDSENEFHSAENNEMIWMMN